MPYATGSAGLAITVRGSSRRIMIMRFRPANIRLINRRLKLPRLLLALSSRKRKDNYKNPTDFAVLTGSLHIRAMHSATSSDHSSRSSEAKLFGIEFSYLHVSKEDSIKPWCDQLDSQLFEAEHFADEDSVLVPTNVAAVVDTS